MSARSGLVSLGPVLLVLLLAVAFVVFASFGLPWLYDALRPVTFVLVVAAILTVPVSLALLWLYSRAVHAGMRRRGAVDASAPDDPPEVAAQLDDAPEPPVGALVFDVVDASSRPDPSATALPTFRSATRGPWTSAAVYAVAGAGYALVATVVMFLATGLAVSPLRALVILWTNLWPVVIAVDLVTVADWRTRARNALVYVAAGAVLAGIARDNWSGVPLFWALVVAPATAVLLLLLHPLLRAVGPLVFAFMVVGVGGALLAYGMVETEAGTLVVGVALVGAVLFGLLGWWALTGVGRLYEAKYVSDQSIVVDLVWLIFALSDALLRSYDAFGWGVVALSSFVVYKILTVVGFAIVSRRAGAKRNARLLLLRVFGFRSRSQRLIALVGSRWRYVGSIQLITATDLASATVEPHEFLDFTRGRLGDRYVKGRADLERRLAGMDVRPDGDGRFRVNDFFCHDDTWKMTLSRLVACNDLVLMDLRGFSPANQGCCFELQELLGVVALCKVVLVVDPTTDVPFLRTVLEQAWTAMPPDSPNRHLRPARVVAFHLTRDGEQGARLVLAGLAEALATDGEWADRSRSFDSASMQMIGR